MEIRVLSKRLLFFGGAVVLILALGYSAYTASNLFVIPTVIACLMLTFAVVLEAYDTHTQASCAPSRILSLWQMGLFAVATLTVVVATLQLVGVAVFAEWSLALVLALTATVALMSVASKLLIRRPVST